MKEKLLFGQSLNEKIPPPEELFVIEWVLRIMDFN
jgi:hypothetical protein